MLLDIEGLIAAPLTPFNKGFFEIELKINLKCLILKQTFLIQSKIKV